VNKPGDKLPFDTESIDNVISTSCFEHDPCFWITFKEMCRITKPGGFIYVNAPAFGPYHKHPGDNWRFYNDAAQALAHWSAIKYNSEPDDGDYPVIVDETFLIDPPVGEIWTDLVSVWHRVTKSDLADMERTKPQGIILPDDIRSTVGPLQARLRDRGLQIRLQQEN